MTDNIPLKNIYYMLSYAFQVLNESGYKNVETEEFENTGDLFAAIIIRGIELQIKKYLNREYVSNTESLTAIKGKIEINETINTMSFIKKQLVCTYDDFSIDSYMNRILKSTIFVLLKSDINQERKKILKRQLQYFNTVRIIDLHHINWQFHYTRNNQTYRMLMGICYLTIHGLLQTQSDGTIKLMDFIDSQRMSHLYEKFILEYYIKHFKIYNPSAKQIDWQLDDNNDYLLPNMKTDITLEYQNKILIIDTKYYSKNLQEQFNKTSAISGHLYQIFTYVKNKEFEMKNKGNYIVSGLLLYAKTDDEIQPDADYLMSGNKISIKNIDLNTKFDNIKLQLNKIIADYFG